MEDLAGTPGGWTLKETMQPCIDRILPADIFRFQRAITERGRLRAVAPIGKTWMNGTTLSVLFLGGTAEQRAIAMEQAGWWSSICNIKFDFSNRQDAQIRVSFNSGQGAWSYIGTDASHIPLDQSTMNLGFLDGGTAAHEFGHALGLGHEHANPAGGIQWNREEVIDALSGPPNHWTLEMIEHNVFNKYSVDQINGTAFDPDSIMLYWFPKEWTLNGVETKANEVLSSLDKSFIAGAKMYPLAGPTPVKARQLEVGAAPYWTDIGAFGEEDLFRFTAEQGGLYVAETSGKTDVIMKLFGPGSETALIAEDDDGGFGLNAQIMRPLIAGKYFLQVRHWNKAKGIGKYGIGVKMK